MSFLIDTDIIIYAVKKVPEVIEWFKTTRNISKSISLITYGELMYGAKNSSFPERNIITVNRIQEMYPVVELNIGIMDVFGALKAKLTKPGNSVADMHLLIASTAVYYNMTLVTNNTKHFSKIEELKLEKWK